MRTTQLILIPLVLAAVGLLAACAAQARSVLLAEPGELAGLWRLQVEAADACELRLTARPAPDGYVAEAADDCADAIGGEAPTQWRPVPDGLELAGADGLTLMLLVPEGPDAFLGRDAQGRSVRLRR